MGGIRVVPRGSACVSHAGSSAYSPYSCITPHADEPTTGGLGMRVICSFISKGVSCLASEK